jgi:ADP-ribose pyrophosphatase
VRVHTAAPAGTASHAHSLASLARSSAASHAHSLARLAKLARFSAVSPPPKVTASRVVYENRWMRLREDRFERADGSEGLYAVVEKSPATVVIAIHDGHVTLVEQFRHPVGERFWELPQGAWDGDEAPDPEELGRGELREETGLRAGSMERLGRLYFAYGITGQAFDVWLATDLTQGEQDLELEEEGLRVGRFSLVDVERRIAEGEIVDSATVAAFGLLRLRRPELLPAR